MKQRIIALMGKSWNEVHDLWVYGRIPDNVWRAWDRVWEWSSAKFGGPPGWRHESFWNTYGKEKYFQKINKTRRAFGLEEIDYAHQ